MCQFISWVENNGEVFYLTDDSLKTKEGKKLVRQLKKENAYTEDIKGHGAILSYYPELKGLGKHKECEDFSTPNNFPNRIVKDIIAGKFTKFSVCKGMLTKKALKEYESIQQPAYKEFNCIRNPAWEEFQSIEHRAMEEYQGIKQKAYREYGSIEKPYSKEYQSIEQPAYKEYTSIEQKALKEYNRRIQPYWEEYQSSVQPAREEYNSITQLYFWNLVKNKKNLIKAWRI